MLQIESRDHQILKQILSKYPYKFYAYGSRAKGTARKFSDLDLCYQEDIPDPTISQIQAELEESDLSFVVELVSWKLMRVTFREIVKKDLIVL